MLKLFLLIPLITLQVLVILGLTYFTIFINTGAGLLAIFIGVIVILSLLATTSFDEKHYGKE